MNLKCNLISVDCPLCSSSKHKPFRKLNGHQISKCVGCDFLFANPRPAEEVILKGYKKASQDDEISFSQCMTEDTPIENYHTWTGVYTLNRLARWGKGSFLDIGAGQGWAVQQALKIGFDAFGFEIGDGRAYENVKRLSDRIYTDESKLSSLGAKFDHLFLSAVFEHVWDPKTFLHKWIQMLKPGGLFTIAALPNMDSIFIRTGLDGWDGNIPFNHLNYFSPRTLQDFLAKNNFEIIDLYTMGMPVSCSISNIWNQKKFENAHWGDNSKNWSFLDNVKKHPPHKSKHRLYTHLVAAANYVLKSRGWGSNIYVTFRIKER